MASKLASQVSEHIRAGFSGIYVTTFEQDDAQHEIGALCQQNGWRFCAWDCDNGMMGAITDPDSTEPFAMLRATADLGENSIVVLRNFHKFLSSIDVIQCLNSRLVEGKGIGITYVILAPSVDLPCEISRNFVVLHHSLPDKDQLRKIADIVAQSPDDLPDDIDTLLDASAGLTRLEAENTYALSIVRHGRIKPDEVWALKAQALEKTGLMRLHQGSERFHDLGGLDNLKSFCLAALRPNPDRKARPRGVLLLGVPGTGKSALARALGNEVGLPTITLDIGALMGSLVGETERKTREAIATIDAMGKCIVFIDELEKALSGANSQGGDSGTSSRQFGALLTWLSDPNKQAFVIATSNDISKMPKEFLRSGRFNAIFFFDLPSKDQKNKIWTIHMKRFGISDETLPDDTDWTGAEIENCVETADLLRVSLVDASKYVIPVAKTASEQVTALREWANSRCISADYEGPYRSSPQTASAPTRRIQRDAS